MITTPNPVGYMLHAYDAGGKSIPPIDLITAYARGPSDLEAALVGLSPEQLRARPIPGRWSTLEVVGHLADCEQFLADRLKRTIALDRPLLIGIDENKYMATFDYHTRDLAEELALIHATRNQITRLLRALPASPDPVWSRPAIHTEAGLMTLHQILFHATYHLQHHLKFITEKRAALGLKPT
jgi:uncharacterized damage-inducible protein DinB